MLSKLQDTQRDIAMNCNHTRRCHREGNSCSSTCRSGGSAVHDNVHVDEH